MKKTIYIVALLVGCFEFGTSKAQLNVLLKANIGAQPVWGPVGHDHVEYYYIPDIDVFYYVPSHQYIYLQRERWIYAGTLPSRYHNYDMYNGYKAVVNDPCPYRHAETYRAKYAQFKGRHNREIIRNSRDSKYFEIKEHPEHNNWKLEQSQQSNDDPQKNEDHNQPNSCEGHHDR